MSYYVDTIDSIRALLTSDSQASYTQLLLQQTTKWSQPFAEHFVEKVNPDVASLGAWELRKYDQESATTNQSELFNFVMKKTAGHC